MMGSSPANHENNSNSPPLGGKRWGEGVLEFGILVIGNYLVFGPLREALPAEALRKASAPAKAGACLPAGRQGIWCLSYTLNQLPKFFLIRKLR
jgi:hypothetical protein